jgi:hypothetical protein
MAGFEVIIEAVHFASFYLDIRYGAWVASSGSRNPSTDAHLSAIRLHSEKFLISPAVGLSGGPDSAD